MIKLNQTLEAKMASSRAELTKYFIVCGILTILTHYIQSGIAEKVFGYATATLQMAVVLYCIPVYIWDYIYNTKTYIQIFAIRYNQ
jgi:hypothetical protein